MAIARKRGRRSTKYLTWDEQQIRIKEKIRNKIPQVGKVALSKIRNTDKHNLCIEMLKDGYHKSYAELDSLINNRKRERLEGGPDSPIWLEPSLEDQHEKLEELSKYLKKAEAMQRSGKWKDVYECRVRLAEYFLTSGDQWLSDHFFESALATSKNIRLDGRRRESEACCNQGLALERQGRVAEAVPFLRSYLELTAGKAWKNDDDVLLSHLACKHLCRVYTTMARRKVVEGDEKLRYLNLAHEVAVECDVALERTRCGINLAQEFEQRGESEKAIKYLNESLEMATDLGEDTLYVQACRGMAVSLQSLGDVERSLEFFEMYGESSRDSKLLPDIASASCCLGEVNITQAEYDKSVEHSESAYQFSKKLGTPYDHPAVLLGLARASSISPVYHGVVDRNSRDMVKKLMLWKDDRLDALTIAASNTDGRETPLNRSLLHLVVEQKELASDSSEEDILTSNSASCSTGAVVMSDMSINTTGAVVSDGEGPPQGDEV